MHGDHTAESFILARYCSRAPSPRRIFPPHPGEVSDPTDSSSTTTASIRSLPVLTSGICCTWTWCVLVKICKNYDSLCWYLRINQQFNTSNIASVKMLSSRALKPLAPVFLDIAFFAISLRAFSVKCNLTWRVGVKFEINRLPCVHFTSYLHS